MVALVTWTKLRSGLYESRFIRPDLNLTIVLHVERGDEDNSGSGDRGWWNYSFRVLDHEGTPQHGSDQGAYDYATMAEARARAERFAQAGHLDQRYGFCA